MKKHLLGLGLMHAIAITFAAPVQAQDAAGGPSGTTAADDSADEQMKRLDTVVVQGEIAYRPNQPLQVDIQDLGFAALGPTLTRCHDAALGCAGSAQLGNIGIGYAEDGTAMNYGSSDFTDADGANPYPDIINVGIRSSYVASYYAAPIMVGHGHGLIVNTSGSGAVHYVYGPGYGAHKAGVDKLAADMAVDFEGTGVTTLSVWMGALLTDRLKMVIASDPEKYGYLKDRVETPEFTGHIIWALYNDPELAALSGRT